MTPEVRDVVLRLDGLPGASLSLADGAGEALDSVKLSLEPDKVLPVRLYVRVGHDDLPAGSTTFSIVVDDPSSGIDRSVETSFEIPEKSK
jgi:hypothetical protein